MPRSVAPAFALGNVATPGPLRMANDDPLAAKGTCALAGINFVRGRSSDPNAGAPGRRDSGAAGAGAVNSRVQLVEPASGLPGRVFYWKHWRGGREIGEDVRQTFTPWTASAQSAIVVASAALGRSRRRPPTNCGNIRVPPGIRGSPKATTTACNLIGAATDRLRTGGHCGPPVRDRRRQQLRVAICRLGHVQSSRPDRVYSVARVRLHLRDNDDLRNERLGGTG